MIEWLIEGGIGPALVALPVNWAGQAGADLARRWFRRIRRSDDLSSLVKAAAGPSVELDHAAFNAVRHLLEDERTWFLAGRGTVEDLITLIASSLGAHSDLADGDRQTVATAIARGLLEFGMADIAPQLFQRVLLARLARLEHHQDRALDQAMLGLQAELVSWLAVTGDLEARRADEMMRQLQRILERLPTAAAGPGGVAVYLKTLIDWLSIDPWPRDQRFGARALNVASLERKLRVTAPLAARRWGAVNELDADDLAEQCHRMVLLGQPGSGKTWFARRTARRSAEAALKALAAGSSLDEVELPLYTTCSRLFSAGGDIREAVVSSAFDQLADMGGSRLNASVRELFTERNAPVILVIDSLDEAPGSDDRLRQADTLPWRILLTSRPSSWNQQLAIAANNNAQRVAELLPLRYPSDVESVIRCWFADDPARGTALAAQIEDRPAVQQAATVPLILGFYCIVGGGQPLPLFRRELYAKVIRRMLTGRWRGSRVGQIDLDACLHALRTWAWSGVRDDPVSGVGAWPDDVPAGQLDLGPAEQEAVDHVAVPAGLPDLDTETTLRRFTHRSIRDYFVAERFASLPVDEAAQVLLPHLWHDPDWENAAPAAIACHSERDLLLTTLVCHAAQSRQLPRDLSLIDAGWQIRELLARVAAESHQRDWSPEIAELISKARVDLALANRPANLSGTTDWALSNGLACTALLERLAGEPNRKDTTLIAAAVSRLIPGADQRQQAVSTFITLLSNPPSQDEFLRPPPLIWDDDTNSLSPETLMRWVFRFSQSAQDKQAAREAILKVLGTSANARVLATGLLSLGATAEDIRQAKTILLRLAANETDTGNSWEWVAAWLVAAKADTRETHRKMVSLLEGQNCWQGAYHLALALAQLSLSPEDERQARAALLNLLAREDAAEGSYLLAGSITKLAPTPDDKHQARSLLLSRWRARLTPITHAN